MSDTNSTTSLDEEIEKLLDFFTEPGTGEKYLKDLQADLLDLFERTALECSPSKPSKYVAYTKDSSDGWKEAINTYKTNLTKAIRGESK